MDNIGAEVGQKMRSAIKAKLMELGCYVDDELPDYIMVMVANKRTKSQMNEDLKLFLATKTSAFVDWLQIVLKKLKEITVTNPDIYKKVSKRKADDSPKIPMKVKKEKKNKSKANKKIKKKEPIMKPIIQDIPQIKSLTDDLPVEASKLSEMRKIVIMQENQNSNSNISNIENVNEDSFDIPPLSQVAMSNENELVEIEKKIRNVKSRLGLQVPSESEDEDFLNLKAEPDELFSNDPTDDTHQKLDDKAARKIQIIRSESNEEQSEYAPTEIPSPKQRAGHPRIVFANESTPPAKKQSVLERLGKRSCDEGDNTNTQKRTRISLMNIRKEEEEILGINKPNPDQTSARSNSGSDREERPVKKDDFGTKRTVTREPPRESALKRLGVMSKVAVPQKEPVESDTEEVINKEVPSAVRVKPRVLPPANNQANKNLLLKAVAEAQRSIAQTPIVGTNKKPDALFTKKYREKLHSQTTSTRKLLNRDKNKIKNILTTQLNKDNTNKKELDFSSDDDNLEYVPKPIKKTPKSNEQLEYIPSAKDQSQADDIIDIDGVVLDEDYHRSPPKENKSQTFIITLDGIVRQQSEVTSSSTKNQVSVQKRKPPEENNKRKSPSPIIFDAAPSTASARGKQILEKLPVIYPPPSLKMKEKCKYWPNCRQGDKCEFIHPTTACKAFPQCKFGDKCLYVHPVCKFETSCTRKDCPYSHTPRAFSTVSNSSLQMCKYFPNCNNIHCMYFHPKPCKFGKYCKNQGECSFSHGFPSKNNFHWRSTVKL